MVKNYFKTALRNLVREKGSTVINIAGLTLGITCSLILFLLVKHLSSFDNYHANRDRIYRIITESDGNTGKFYTPGVPPVFPDAFRNDFPEAEEVTFISNRSDQMITVIEEGAEPKKYIEENGVAFGQSNFFRIFDRQIVSGDKSNALDAPQQAVISKSLAQKYFNTIDVLGKIVKFDTIEFKITAIMEDFPVNTDFPFNLFLSYATIKSEKEKSGWQSTWSDEQCYIKIKQDHKASQIAARLPDFTNKYIGKENYNHKAFYLQPLSEMHFDDRYGVYSGNTSPKEMLMALSVIALFLIITACINFINLSTAEAVKRSKEVGIRKSLGSSRAQLVMQFLGETTIVTIIAMVISVAFAQLALTALNTFLETQISFSLTTDGLLWFFILSVTVIVSLLSGLYPALIISGYRPVLALKNQISNKNSTGYNLRRGLVILQFVISQFFIIGTIVLINQMNFFHKKELGFRKDAILLIPVPDPGTLKAGTVSKTSSLRNEVSALAGVEAVSLNSAPPSSGSVSGTGFIFEGEEESQRKATQVKQVDRHYLDIFDIQLLAGENVGDNDTATSFLVNEELTKVAGFVQPQDIVGKKIKMWGQTLPVAGVVSNFHTESLKQKIEPVILFNRAEGYWNLSVKVNQSEMQNVISQIKPMWERAYPEHIFSYEFLDDHIREFYEGEQKMSVLLSLFSSMAIFIGCLGLFGLATFLANQKTKEIGVRKALGATMESIVFLFTKEYIKLIVIGFVIAAPLAWLTMNEWLSEFEYKIEIGAMVFIAGFSITLAIALLSVGYKSIKAAIVNPVKSLRYE